MARQNRTMQKIQAEIEENKGGLWDTLTRQQGINTDKKMK